MLDAEPCVCMSAGPQKVSVDAQMQVAAILEARGLDPPTSCATARSV